MTDKYPNADTSPERLAQLTQAWSWLLTAPHALNTEEKGIRDLLAMLQEKDEAFKFENDALRSAAQKLTQQLHDQWWRRLSEEEPQRLQNVDMCRQLLGTVMKYSPVSSTLYQTHYNYYGLNINNEKDRALIWWRPIPPLPKDQKENT